MKKYIISALAVLSAATMFTSCDDMLDTDPRVTSMTQATFPGKPADVEALNAATYSIMNTMGGGDADSQNPFYWWEIMSDNCYGSGGLQDDKVKSLHYLVQMNSNQYEQVYTLLFGGISRANNQIETIDNFTWKDTKKRNQLLGEAYFMRGLYTLWLTQLYGDVPLITSTTITSEMETQVSAEEKIYPQILSDFVSGSNLMGNKAYAGDGHANKYVAEGFIGRAYMFWAGFYKNVKDLSTGDASLELVKQEGCEGGTMAKENVVKYLKDVIDNGGYKLCDDYRSLWQYSNSLLWDEAHDGKGHAYEFIADMKRENCFDMPGMGNGNTEEMFQIQFLNASRWGINGANENGGPYSSARMYCNYLSVFWGLRVNGDNGKQDATYPFMQGWGQGTPSCNIWDDWTLAENADPNNPYTDIRKKASLIDCNNELANYSYVKDDCEESGYAVKKWCGVTLDVLPIDEPWWTKAPGYSSSSLENKFQGDHFEDFYLMRYPDVLLMASELTGDVQYMNRVQERAGVPLTKEYSLKAIQNERRWEFAFEGIRFNDMRRWTGKGTKDGYATKALQAQSGKQVVCYGDVANKKTMQHMHHDTSSWKDRYEATDGFLAKPQSQINLMNGKLQQNPGWDGSVETLYKSLY